MAAPANVTLCCTRDTLATVSEGQSMIQSDSSPDLKKKKKNFGETHVFPTGINESEAKASSCWQPFCFHEVRT